MFSVLHVNLDEGKKESFIKVTLNESIFIFIFLLQV
jgi:hypothetical protein